MKKIWQWLSGNVIKDVGDAIDKLTTTKEEKLQIKKEIQVIIEKATAEADIQITKRWESDMTSDSWLSKNTRPIAAPITINIDAPGQCICLNTTPTKNRIAEIRLVNKILFFIVLSLIS